MQYATGNQVRKAMTDLSIDNINQIEVIDNPDVKDIWELRLYVAGQTPKSVIAFANLKKICEEYMPGKYRIEVIDLIQNPQLAKGDQILAVPTLVKKFPPPLNKIIGDLSNTQRVLVGLDLVPLAEKSQP